MLALPPTPSQLVRCPVGYDADPIEHHLSTMAKKRRTRTMDKSAKLA
jgi:hypothetical protein